MRYQIIESDQIRSNRIRRIMLLLCDETRKLFKPLNGPVFKSDVLQLGLSESGDFILDAYAAKQDAMGKNIRSRCSAGLSDLIKRIPEKYICHKSESTGYYSPYIVGATDCTVELINHLCPEQNLRFECLDTEASFKLILQKAAIGDMCAELTAAYKLNKTVPNHEYELNWEKPLACYQQVGLCSQQMSEGYGLFMEQGTGKTPLTIASICNGSVRHKDAGKPGMYKAIIVCPNNLRSNWVSEFHNFATRPGRITVLKGTAIDRVKGLCDAFAYDESEGLYYSVVICGYQTLWRTWESLRLLEWDIAVLDEAHAIKDAKALQSKGCLELRDRSKQRVVLTGTPIANSPLDLYMLLEFMDRGGSGFTSEKAFKSFYGAFERTESGHDILVGCQNLPFLQERLTKKSFFISKKEALPDLPEKVYDILEVEMSEPQQAAYNKLSRELAISIESQLASDTLQRSMMVNNILTQLLRLSQITSGFVSWSEVQDLNGDVEQPAFYEYFEENPKIEAVLQLLLEKGPTEKTIIWANWIPDIEFLASACEQNNIRHCVFRGLHKGYKDEDRQESVRRFNEDRDCKVFIGTPGSGGSGLNLLGYPPGAGEDYDTDCTHIIYFSQDWSSIKRSQSEDRAHRRGTRRSVRYTTIVVPDSIDTQILKRVSEKQQTALDVSDLRKILNVVVNFKA